MISLLLVMACNASGPKPCLIVTKDKYAFPASQVLYMQEYECGTPDTEKYPCTAIEFVDSHLQSREDFAKGIDIYYNHTRVVTKDRLNEIVEAYTVCSK